MSLVIKKLKPKQNPILNMSEQRQFSSYRKVKVPDINDNSLILIDWKLQ